ncbi:MAG: hypothetical protein ACT4P7_15345 [Gemmatimonadaceae bacterium]
MRTAIIIVAGFVLLAAFVAVPHLLGTGGVLRAGTPAKVFIPVWFAVAAVNMWIGVSRAGYSVREELPIFLVIFLIPAVAGLLIARRYP